MLNINARLRNSRTEILLPINSRIETGSCLPPVALVLISEQGGATSGTPRRSCQETHYLKAACCTTPQKNLTPLPPRAIEPQQRAMSMKEKDAS